MFVSARSKRAPRLTKRGRRFWASLFSVSLPLSSNCNKLLPSSPNVCRIKSDRMSSDSVNYARRQAWRACQHQTWANESSPAKGVSARFLLLLLLSCSSPLSCCYDGSFTESQAARTCLKPKCGPSSCSESAPWPTQSVFVCVHLRVSLRAQVQRRLVPDWLQLARASSGLRIRAHFLVNNSKQIQQ